MHMQSIPKATSPLATWLYYLEQLHSSAIDLGLKRVGLVAKNLDLLHPADYIFTVAGTNGKGTTCRTLESILINAGYRVGVYSSPHLLHYTERVRIQGLELPERSHCAALDYIEQGRGEISLSYFEFSTLSALHLFKNAKLDVVILEVGLGGRLDATNIVDADVSVVTTIALDHTDWLGSDRDSIGREKAGIFRTNRPAIVGEYDMPYSISAYAEHIGAKLKQVGKDWNYQVVNDKSWSWTGNNCVYHQLPMPHIPIANAATALAALNYSSLTVSEIAIQQGIEQARLPGRFQIVSEQPRVILDVAHNPHASAYLASKLNDSTFRGGKLRAVVAMLADKDISGTLGNMCPLIDKWYCAPLEGARGTTVEQIACHLPDAAVFNSVEQAWQQARLDADKNDTIIVFGSFHTVAKVMAILDMEKTDD